MNRCRSLDAEIAHLRGRGRNLSLDHYHVPLRPQNRRRFVPMIEDLTNFVLEHNDPEHGVLHSYAAVFSAVSRPDDSSTGVSDA